MAILRRHRPRTPLAGRTVLITGAARGIGAELARKAAARGARVALVGLEPEELARVADELGPRAPVGGGRRHRPRGAEGRRPADRGHLRRARHRRRQCRHRPADHGDDVVGARAGPHDRGQPDRRDAHHARRAAGDRRAQGPRAADQLGRRVHRAARHERLLRGQGRGGAVRRRAAARGRPPRGHRGQRAPDLDRHRHGPRHRGRAADVREDPQAAAGPARRLHLGRGVRRGAGGEPGDPAAPGVRARLGRRRLGAAPDGHRRPRGEGGDEGRRGSGAAARARHPGAERPGVRQELDRRPAASRTPSRLRLSRLVQLSRRG